MTTSDAESEALVRRFLLEVIEGGDTASIDAFTHGDAVARDPTSPSGSRDAQSSRLASHVLASAEVTLDLEEVVGTADAVGVRGSVNGTTRPTVFEPLVSGRTFEIPYVWFCHLDDGRIEQIWSMTDRLELIQQVAAGVEIRMPVSQDTTEEPR